MLHKLANNVTIVYATNLELQLLWHFEESLSIQRFYLYASHGCLWLNTAQFSTLLHQENGCELAKIDFPAYRKVLPELESQSEDTSPYAQTGYSIWDIKTTTNRIFLVHDIERCAPVIFDTIEFL